MLRDTADLQSQDIAEVYELAVLDAEGERMGIVVGVCGGCPGRAEWLRVRLGLFGLRLAAIPVRGAVVLDGAVRVPYPRDRVWDAPPLHDHVVSERMAETLRRHYGRRAEPVTAA